MTRVIVLDHAQNGWECHKVGCRDLDKKSLKFNNSWEEESLAIAEESFNLDLGVDAGFEDPWIWERDVRVFPCARG
jgi:hypothetical protein